MGSWKWLAPTLPVRSHGTSAIDMKNLEKGWGLSLDIQLIIIGHHFFFGDDPMILHEDEAWENIMPLVKEIASVLPDFNDGVEEGCQVSITFCRELWPENPWMAQLQSPISLQVCAISMGLSPLALLLVSMWGYGRRPLVPHQRLGLLEWVVDSPSIFLSRPWSFPRQVLVADLFEAFQNQEHDTVTMGWTTWTTWKNMEDMPRWFLPRVEWVQIVDLWLQDGDVSLGKRMRDTVETRGNMGWEWLTKPFIEGMCWTLRGTSKMAKNPAPKWWMIF